jgi:hypothetical protein
LSAEQELNMVQPGDSVPHFEVRTLQGEQFRYSTIWQRRNLVFVTLSVSELDREGPYVSQLLARGSDFARQGAECVFTRDHLPWLPGPGVLVADRWGEVVHAVISSDVADLPSPQELIDWVAYVQTRCPECEGEAK